MWTLQVSWLSALAAPQNVFLCIITRCLFAEPCHALPENCSQSTHLLITSRNPQWHVAQINYFSALTQPLFSHTLSCHCCWLLHFPLCLLFHVSLLSSSSVLLLCYLLWSIVIFLTLLTLQKVSRGFTEGTGEHFLPKGHILFWAAWQGPHVSGRWG